MDTEEKVFGCLILIVLVVMMVPLVLSFTGLHINTGNGQHTGYVTAVQKQGLFFKTWRAYIKTDTSSSQEDTYCVVDEDVVKKLQSAAEEKKQVTVTYFSWLFSGVANCDGESDVIDGTK